MPTKETKAVESAEKTVVNNFVSFEEIVSSLTKDQANRSYNCVVTACSVTDETAANGNHYKSLMLTFERPILAAQRMPDGTHQMGYIGSIKLPYWQIELVMRRNKFFGRFIHYLSEAAEAGVVDQFIVGLNLNVVGEFVAAGEEKSNPFTRKDNSYGIKDYDRYIFHVISIGDLDDAMLKSMYAYAAQENQNDIRKRIELARAKKQAAASFAAIAPADSAISDLPL